MNCCLLKYRTFFGNYQNGNYNGFQSRSGVHSYERSCNHATAFGIVESPDYSVPY